MRSFNRAIAVPVIALAFVLGASSALSATIEVLDGEYRLPASIHSSVTTEAKTELWAHVWRPRTGGPHPLVVLLHGNHGTCGRFVPELATGHGRVGPL